MSSLDRRPSNIPRNASLDKSQGMNLVETKLTASYLSWMNRFPNNFIYFLRKDFVI